ncbi:MAG: hypothetical protein FJ356_01820 [Thaumarchaeota archaeon]|nr:hypothetical protein [Nitrososphaerota archaeon]
MAALRRIASLVRLLPDFHSILITDKEGELVSYVVSENCAARTKLAELKDIAKLFSYRIRLGKYNELFENFQSVVVLFDNHYMIGRFIPEDKILTTIISKKSSDLISTLKTIFDLGRYQETKEKLKQIPPLPVQTQNHGEKLVAKKYTLVALPIGDSRQSKV